MLKDRLCGKLAWVDGFDGDDNLTLKDFWPEPDRLIRNAGRGLLIQGTRQWKNYKVSVRMTPHMCEAGGIGLKCKNDSAIMHFLLKENETHLIRESRRKRYNPQLLLIRSWKPRVRNMKYHLKQMKKYSSFAWINQEKISKTKT